MLELAFCLGSVEAALESFGALLRLHDRWTDSLFPSGNYVPWYYIANHSESIMAFACYIRQISNCATGHFLISSQRCTWSLFSKVCWSCSGQFVYLLNCIVCFILCAIFLCVLLSGENSLSSWKSMAPTAVQARRGTLRISMVCTSAPPPTHSNTQTLLAHTHALSHISAQTTQQ